MMINTQHAPHDTSCRCAECHEWLHSYHEEFGLIRDCPLCYPMLNALMPWLIHAEPTIQTERCYSCFWENHDRLQQDPDDTDHGVPMRQLTGRTRTVNERCDATESYEMTCGHWGI